MAKNKKENIENAPKVENNFDDLWLLLLLPLLFGFNEKPNKVINIYMGDE